MRNCFLGDTGDGKTASAIDFLDEYQKLGYSVYANIKLKMPYTFIDNINFQEIVNNKEFNIILIDEIGEFGKSGSSTMFNFTQMISQSRKSIGEKHHLFVTTQTKFQSNPTLRALLDYIIYPEIMFKLPANKEGLEKPVIIRLDWYQKIKRTIPPEFWFSHSTYRYVLDTLDLYDSFKEVEPMKDLSFVKYLKKYSEWVGNKQGMKNLRVLILSQEGKNKTDSTDLARKIIYADKLFPEELKKLKKINKK